MQNISTVLESLSFYLKNIQPFEFLVSLNPRFIPRSIFFYRERFKFEKKFQKSLISNLSTCGFHDVSKARTTCAIFSLRGPSMSAFIALPSKSSGSATNTPASFRLGKQTDFSSPSVFPSFSHLGELSKPYIGSIGFPRERKNLCSEHWPPHRLFQLTIPQPSKRPV